MPLLFQMVWNQELFLSVKKLAPSLALPPAGTSSSLTVDPQGSFSEFGPCFPIYTEGKHHVSLLLSWLGCSEKKTRPMRVKL